MKRHGGHVVVIGSRSGIGLAATRLARHEGTEVTIAGRFPEVLLQAPRELEKMHTVVMDITDEGAVEKGFAGLSHVDHVLVTADDRILTWSGMLRRHDTRQ